MPDAGNIFVILIYEIIYLNNQVPAKDVSMFISCTKPA